FSSQQRFEHNCRKRRRFRPLKSERKMLPAGSPYGSRLEYAPDFVVAHTALRNRADDDKTENGAMMATDTSRAISRSTPAPMTDFAILVGRVMIGLIFVRSGWPKLLHYQATVD